MERHKHGAKTSDASIDNSKVQVFFDNKHLFKSLFIKRKLYEIYRMFALELNVACEYPRKFGNVP
jgi:hypothetical protein